MRHLTCLLVLLTLVCASCGEPHGLRSVPGPAVVVLYSGQQELLPDATCESCVLVDVQDAATLARVEGRLVVGFVLSGHSSSPQHVLGVDPTALYQLMARLQPRPSFVVLDTCFGASSDVLLGLIDAGVDADLVLGPPSRIPIAGFNYDANFGRVALSDPGSLADVVSCCDDRARRLTVFRRGYEAPLRVLLASQLEAARRCEGEIPFATLLPNRVPVERSCGAGSCPIDGRVLVAIPKGDWCPDASASFAVLAADGVTSYRPLEEPEPSSVEPWKVSHVAAPR